MEQLVAIGRIQKPHGLSGELKVFVEDTYLEDFFQSEVLFLNINGLELPYFREELEESNALTVKLEEVETREAAKRLSNAVISLRASDIIPDEARTLTSEDGLKYSKYQGYTLHDKTVGAISVIQEVVELPQQELAVIDYKGKELFIPLHEQLILEIDDTAKILLLDLPEGLLDL